jgi:hypothetical protein
MAKTIVLVVKRHIEDCTQGKNITRARVVLANTLAEDHSFRWSGFRLFVPEVTEAQIAQVRQHARMLAGENKSEALWENHAY